MAATSILNRPPMGVVHRRPADSFDHVFFPAMAVLVLVSVFVGFARTYYLAGVLHAPLPNRLVHVHAVVFTLWVLLLITQTSLVAAGRTDVHTRLGILGFALATSMVVLGVMVATDWQGRHFVPGPAGVPARAFYTVTLSIMLAFAILIAGAFLNRRNPPAHKRLILIATIAILDAAFQRWPVPAKWWGLSAAALVCTVPLLLTIAAYDYWSRGRVLRTTLWAGLLVVALQQVRAPVGRSAPWQTFAAWAARHAQSWSRSERVMRSAEISKT